MKSRTATGIVAGLVMLAAAPIAHAASVTVHVEGGSGVVVPPTAVQTGAFTVNKDGTNTCTGTSAAGALELATGGDWTGEFDFGSYIARVIKGEDYPKSQNDYYWGFSVDGVPASSGMCGVELTDGQEVLFYKACYLATTGCLDGTVLALSAPATAAPGAPVTVTVTETRTDYPPPNYEPTTTRGPASGVSVAGGGATATTGADGRATLTLANRGPATLRATRDANVPDQLDVCVTDGGDGFCGNARPVQGAGPVACATSGDDGFCGTPDRRAGFGVVRSIEEGQRFRRGRGPRELKGAVDGEAALAGVQLRLTGRDGRRCSTYDARREDVVRMARCGAARGRWFSAGTSADWTYLLPERLGRGRWVLDVRTSDKAGNRNQTLQRGRTRVVFHVG